MINNDFWETKHIEGDINALSGCEYKETLDILKMTGRIKDTDVVLEIGVGLGYSVKELHRRNIKVSAVDISDSALRRVEGYCEKTYLVDQLNELPTDYFDVILCVNVIQHIPTKELNEEMREIMRSLKTGGIFAVEFVSSDAFEDNGENCSVGDAQAGRLCRSPKFLENIFKKNYGKCELVFSKSIEHVLIDSYHIFHVTK